MNDPFKRKAWYRNRRIERKNLGLCPECGLSTVQPFVHCEACRIEARQYKKNNPKLVAGHGKRFRDNLRMEIYEAYGGARCACCGETEYKFLALDHIVGGGYAHRKRFRNPTAFFIWLKRNKFPSGYQVLCHNCNLAKGFYGECPHKAAELKIAYSAC